MANIRTCLKPDVSYLSASGNPCTFNTGLGGHGKDLQKCVVSFMATQLGSGTPSPYNKRPIVPVSSVDLSVNSVSVIVPLGDSYGGGTLDLLTGKCIITRKIANLGSLEYSYQPQHTRFSAYISDLKKTSSNYQVPSYKCSIYKPVSGLDFDNNTPNYAIRGATSGGTIFIRNTDYTDAQLFKTAMAGILLDYELETPIELTLTPEALTQIASQNTISGGAEITNIEVDYLRIGPTSVSGMAESFKIPSASYPEVIGNPITFDTEFALPLKKCVISFNEVSAISSIDVTVNGTTTTISFGESLTEGSVDVVSGILTRADSTIKQLTPTQLSSIVGQNTISTTGDSISAKYIRVEP